MERASKYEVTEAEDLQALANGVFNVLLKRYGDSVTIRLSSVLDSTHKVCKIYIEGQTEHENKILDHVPGDIDEILQSYQDHDILLPPNLQHYHEEKQNEQGGDVHIITLTI